MPLLKMCAACLGFIISSQPADRIQYNIPKAFEIESQVSYGDRYADISFTLRSRFNFKKTKIRLKPSHEGLMLKTDKVVFDEVKFDADFKKGTVYSYKYRVLIEKKFTLASVAVFISYPFPKSAMLARVEDHADELYPLKHARENLYKKIENAAAQREEIYGIFLYGDKFSINGKAP